MTINKKYVLYIYISISFWNTYGRVTIVETSFNECLNRGVIACEFQMKSKWVSVGVIDDRLALVPVITRRRILHHWYRPLIEANYPRHSVVCLLSTNTLSVNMNIPSNSPVPFPSKCTVWGRLMFLLCTSCWTTNRISDDLWRHDVNVASLLFLKICNFCQISSNDLGVTEMLSGTHIDSMDAVDKQFINQNISYIINSVWLMASFKKAKR